MSGILVPWFVWTISRSSSKVKVIGQCSTSQNQKNVIFGGNMKVKLGKPVTVQACRDLKANLDWKM